MQTLFNLKHFVKCFPLQKCLHSIWINTKWYFEFLFSQMSSSRNNRKFEMVFLIRLLNKSKSFNSLWNSINSNIHGSYFILFSHSKILGCDNVRGKGIRHHRPAPLGARAPPPGGSKSTADQRVEEQEHRHPPLVLAAACPPLGHSRSKSAAT
jgi:hypothetical protein